VRAPRAPFGTVLINACGAGLAILAAGVIGLAADEPLLIAPLGATSVLLFAVSDGVMSQPRNVLLGHLIAVVLGVALAHLLGSGWTAATVAVAPAVFLMLLAHAIHAPAGSTAVIAAIEPHDWLYNIGVPVLASVALVFLVALVFNNLVPGRRYPLRWL
jgi:CBS-domain-containing membrane protein